MKQYQKYFCQFLRVSAVLLVGFFALNGSFGTAQAADKNTLTIGVLDEATLSDKYEKYQTAMKSIDSRAQQLDEQLKARDLLNAQEGERFDALIVKEALTADEQAELDKLIKAGNDRREELLSLSGKATRTDQENERIKDLQATLKTNTDATQKLQDSLLKTLLEQKHTTESKYAELANTAVAEVAKNKNLTLVISKTIAIWSVPTIDITEEVAKQLNKAK